ncbi:hypothetical protein Nans01_13940 [Nocardiopsis ansamitocini]|uniref:Uncharacterized protein n=1 Tax=Nocardiopsis ansamitocini TaxID=1670832 RepID=A0A9W6UI49_9ACTN|nr:hypothetical protein Nans01_13940 [Nocardiopsis ansamitocini]
MPPHRTNGHEPERPVHLPRTSARPALPVGAEALVERIEAEPNTEQAAQAAGLLILRTLRDILMVVVVPAAHSGGGRSSEPHEGSTNGTNGSELRDSTHRTHPIIKRNYLNRHDTRECPPGYYL